VLPEGDEFPEKIRYQAASPDEAALVIAAKNFGFFFYRFRLLLCVNFCIICIQLIWVICTVEKNG